DLAGLADGVAGSLEGAADGALDRGGGLGVAFGKALPALLGEFLERAGAKRLARAAQGLAGVGVRVAVAGQALEGGVEFAGAAADLRLVLEHLIEGLAVAAPQLLDAAFDLALAIDQLARAVQ